MCEGRKIESKNCGGKLRYAAVMSLYFFLIILLETNFNKFDTTDDDCVFFIENLKVVKVTKWISFVVCDANDAQVIELDFIFFVNLQ